MAASGSACIELLRWALPRLGLRWEGFRRVRRQVCRRIDARVKALGLPGVHAYRAYLDAHPDEWDALDACCLVSISRFARDREVFEQLAETILPALATDAVERGARALRAWSAGCASGEEPRSLALYWRFRVAPRFPGLSLQIVATDANAALLARARAGRYARSSLRELPAAFRDAAFDTEDGTFVVREAFRGGVAFTRQDIRRACPAGPFDLVLCRNQAFTYFDEATQARTLERIRNVTRPGAALVIGRTELLPGAAPGLVPWGDAPGIFRRVDHR